MVLATGGIGLNGMDSMGRYGVGMYRQVLMVCNGMQPLRAYRTNQGPYVAGDERLISMVCRTSRRSYG